MTDLAVEVKNLRFSYQDIPILEDITFSVTKGDFLGLLGPNGGGKTTLLKVLLGILKPCGGEIKVLGEAPHNAKHRVGYMPQNADFNIKFPISVREIVLMGRLYGSRPRWWYSRMDHQKTEAVLKKVGMWEHRFTSIGHLSGGQRQRVLIARALATDPEILFLDEPTASVDPEFETDLFDFMKELNKTVTILMVTHDIGVISRNVKSVACVNRTMIFHRGGEITQEMIDMAYGCPVDLVAHGLPHRVLPVHQGK
jgi:zinc transport system ATP-binding protein